MSGKLFSYVLSYLCYNIRESAADAAAAAIPFAQEDRIDLHVREGLFFIVHFYDERKECNDECSERKHDHEGFICAHIRPHTLSSTKFCL